MHRPVDVPARFVLVILILLLFATGSVGATDVSGDVSQHGPEPTPSSPFNDSTYTQFGTQTTGSLRQLTELQRLPGTPGKISIRVKYTIPRGVASLSTHLPAGAERPDTGLWLDHSGNGDCAGTRNRPEITVVALCGFISQLAAFEHRDAASTHLVFSLCYEAEEIWSNWLSPQ